MGGRSGQSSRYGSPDASRQRRPDRVIGWVIGSVIGWVIGPVVGARVLVPTVSRLDQIGEAAGWRCWLCDEPVDPEMSVNDPRGPSVDSITTKAKAKSASKKNRGSGPPAERLAHRGCNTNKGATAPEVPWPDRLFVVDPAPIIAAVERLERKGGREIMGRCPTDADAGEAADWLVDRIARLAPDLAVTSTVESGGGQYLVVLHAQS